MEHFDKQLNLETGQGVCDAAKDLSLIINALETTALSWKSGLENCLSMLFPNPLIRHPQTRINLDNDLLSPAPEKVGTDFRSDSMMKYAEQPEGRDLTPASPKTDPFQQEFEFTEKEVVNIIFRNQC